MRKLLLVSIALCTLAASAQSQSTSSPASQPANESPAIKGSGMANFIPRWAGPRSQGNSLLYQSGSNLGLGTTNPQAMLDVFSAEPIAVQGLTTSDANDSIGLHGLASSTATNVYGVAGDTGSTGYSAGVIGTAYANSGNAFGGFFQAASPDANGLFAYNSATSGYPVALSAQIESANGAAGAFKTHSGSGFVLLGQSGPNFTNVFWVELGAL